MRTRALFMPVIALSIFFASPIGAQYEEDKDKSKDVNVPPGMELRKVGSLNLVVPEGAQMHKDRSQWIMEGPEDFAARSISEIKTRLDGVEKEQKELKNSIEELREAVKKARGTPAPDEASQA